MGFISTPFDKFSILLAMKGCDSLKTFQFTVAESLRTREAEMTFWTFLGVVFMTPFPLKGDAQESFQREGSALRSNSFTL